MRLLLLRQLADRLIAGRGNSLARGGALIAAVLLTGWLAGCERMELARGSAVYDQHCAVCHGSAGRGQNPARPYGSIAPEQEGWIAPALDTRGHCFLHTRAQLFSIIRDGSPFPGTPMLGFKDKLTDNEIRAVIAYLVSLWDRNTRREYESREQLLEELRRKAG
jgi:mono/diheme cytochrome c family protein